MKEQLGDDPAAFFYGENQQGESNYTRKYREGYTCLFNDMSGFEKERGLHKMQYFSRKVKVNIIQNI
ncbi:hypothetical protein UB32_10260 [Mesobacillus subterraneus]|uniref:Uncharacterized protein n=2 Tax=Mesobacillus TaxID=2675231 RepID=A0A0D6ZAL8_9BACI|nr:hypothetical protein UB32_10260 [Mesobacillus subterraneus]MDQ0415371.1 hypothetical protein [Mesobacillus stamsii]